MKAEKGECPVDHSKLNPHNMMPSLNQEMQPGQKLKLSTERTESSIRNTTTNSKWEYPSPQVSISNQQFYNALVRKGKPVPEEHVESMVDIHNFLNEGSWQEILKWEKKYHCDCDDISLAQFKGRPNDLSPKAFFYSTFYGTKPFDRHDWYVDRCGQKVRYVIDYYGGGSESEFHVDVRPAVDSFSSLFDRVRNWFE
jgi:cytochrome c heme-lyase